MFIAQKQITTIYTLFEVTTCLYLNPSTRARSLSTLIAVRVNKDNKLIDIPAANETIRLI